MLKILSDTTRQRLQSVGRSQVLLWHFWRTCGRGFVTFTALPVKSKVKQCHDHRELSLVSTFFVALGQRGVTSMVRSCVCGSLSVCVCVDVYLCVYLSVCVCAAVSVSVCRYFFVGFFRRSHPPARTNF